MKHSLRSISYLIVLLFAPAAPSFAQDLNGADLTLSGAITQNGSGYNYFNGYFSSFNGSTCLGNACASSGEVNGLGNPPLRLKWTEVGIIFEDSSSASFPDRDWRIRINGGPVAESFSIQDEGVDWNSGSPVTPFIISGGAPDNALVVEAGTGDLGIGLLSPLAPLHVFRNDATQEFMFLESNAAGVQDRAMMQLANNGGIRFQFDNPVLGTAWRFQAATGGQDNFEVTKVGTGEIEFRIDAAGNALLAGVLSENSDRNAKRDIEPVDTAEILDKVTAVPVAEWAYKDTPDTRHIGPMAQDFHAAFGTGDSDKRLATLDVGGVAIAAIQALAAQNRELAAQSAELQRQNARLSERLSRLEAAQAH